MAAVVVASSMTVVGMSAVGRRDGCPCSSSSTARLPHQVPVTSRRNLVRDHTLSCHGVNPNSLLNEIR